MRRHAKAIVAASAMLLTLAIAASLAGATAPLVTIEPAAEVGFTTAKAEGEVDPGEKETSYRFEYLTDSQFDENEANSLPGFEGANQVGHGSFSLEEAEGITGLTPVGPVTLEGLTHGTEYHLRLIAENEDGTESAATTFTTQTVSAPTVAIDDPSAVTATSAHFSGDVNPNGTDPAFDTSWSFSCTPICPGLEGGNIPATEASVEVEADTAGLQPNTEYTVTLKATNLGGTSEASKSFETPEAAPSVTAYAAGPIQADQVRINGQVNPHNSATVYWFEWGSQDCSASPCTAIPAEKDAFAGADGQNRYVTRRLTGLQPETTYHFRLIAKNSAGTTTGPDQQFTTAAELPACTNQGAPGAGFLPACRAWEMVSPPDKNGGDISPDGTRTRAAADGNGVAYTSLVGFADLQAGSQVAPDYIARRTALPGTPGWSTHAITPRQDGQTQIGVASALADPLYVGELSPDLSRGVYRSWPTLTDAPAGVAEMPNLYLREDLTTPGVGSYQLLSKAFAPIPFLTVLGAGQNAKPFLAGTSADFSHGIFESRFKLTPDGGTGSQFRLYEWGDGETRLASRVPPSPETFCDDAGAPPDCITVSNSHAGQGASSRRYTPHMISADGSRVFFRSNSGETSGRIYVRENGTTTTQLNVSEREIADEPQPADLWDASVDGSLVFFTTGENLVEEDDDGASDLYMYDFDGAPEEHLTLLSPDGEPTDVDSLRVVVGASEDGEWVYFITLGQLVAGEPVLQSARGLYLWHEGSVRFIGTLAANDADINGLQASWNNKLTHKTSRISPDGQHFLFMSRSGEGFAGRGGFEGYDHGSSNRELYLYSASSGAVTCVSCNPTGTPATANAFAHVREEAGGASGTSYLNHALTDDGRRVFFSSAERLVEEDTNGKSDAYEYDTQTGQVHLLSSGTDESPSYFMDASSDGDDVFILTREQLSDWDVDNNYDLYDARVNGGFPEPEPELAPCNGDDCRGGAPRSAPAQAPAASADLVGPGDPVPNRARKRCARGKRKVRAKGKPGKTRCVRRKRANDNRRAGR